MLHEASAYALTLAICADCGVVDASPPAIVSRDDAADDAAILLSDEACGWIADKELLDAGACVVYGIEPHARGALPERMDAIIVIGFHQPDDHGYMLAHQSFLMSLL